MTLQDRAITCIATFIEEVDSVTDIEELVDSTEIERLLLEAIRINLHGTKEDFFAQFDAQPVERRREIIQMLERRRDQH